MTPVRPEAFEVKDSAMVTLALGKRAGSLRELRNGVAEVPLSSIHHHVFQTLLRHTFDDPEYRNDFALWARRQLHDVHLAERFDLMDPIEHPSLEDLRRHVLAIIDARLREIDHDPAVAPGRQFHFLCSQLVVFTTGLRAEDPAQLAALIPRLAAGSIYYHFVEARGRHATRRDDFSEWLEGWGSGTGPARERLAGIDYYLLTLTEMRDLVAGCLEGLPEEVGTG
jgi:hypothetical protein